MDRNEKDMKTDVREKAEYVAPQLVRIADIAQATEASTIFGRADGSTMFS